MWFLKETPNSFIYLFIFYVCKFACLWNHFPVLLFMFIFSIASLCSKLTKSSVMLRQGTNELDKLGLASLTVWNMKTWKAMVCASVQQLCTFGICFNMNTICLTVRNILFCEDSASSWWRPTGNYFSLFQSQRENFSSFRYWRNDSYVRYPCLRIDLCLGFRILLKFPRVIHLRHNEQMISKICVSCLVWCSLIFSKICQRAFK